MKSQKVLMIFFSTSGLFLFFVHYRGDEITDVVRVPRNCGAPQAPLLIIHYLSPLHIYVVKIWQWRFSFYVNWKYLFNVHPFITGLSDDKQPHNRLGNLYYILLTSSHLQKKKPQDAFWHFYLSVLSRLFVLAGRWWWKWWNSGYLGGCLLHLDILPM